MRLVSPAAIIFCTALSASVAAAAPDNQSVFGTVKVGKNTEVSLHVLDDRFTALLITTPSAANSKALLRQLEGRWSRSSARNLPGGGKEFQIRTFAPIIDHSLERTKSGISMSLRLIRPRDALRSRLLKALPRTVPSIFAAQTFAQAERAFQAGRYTEAKRRFSALAAEYALRAWSRLRLADISFVRGNGVVACRLYEDVSNSYDGRSTALLADMRQRVLRCPQGRRKKMPWSSTTKRLRVLSGAIGEHLWKEAAWALALTRDPKEIEFALDLKDSGDEQASKFRSWRVQLPRKTRLSMTARLIRVSTDPVERTLHCIRRAKTLQQHPERDSLHLLCAEAMLTLDLWRPAEKLLSPLIGTPRNDLFAHRRGDLRALTLLARAYRAGGMEDMVASATEELRQRMPGSPLPAVLDPDGVNAVTLPDTTPEKNLRDLRERVRTVSTVVSALEKGRL